MPKYNKIHIDIITIANGEVVYRPWASDDNNKEDLGIEYTFQLYDDPYRLTAKNENNKVFSLKEEAIYWITKLIKMKNKTIENKFVIKVETETIDINQMEERNSKRT